MRRNVRPHAGAGGASELCCAVSVTALELRAGEDCGDGVAAGGMALLFLLHPCSACGTQTPAQGTSLLHPSQYICLPTVSGCLEEGHHCHR